MSERYVIKDRWIFDTKLNKNIHSIDCYEEKSVLDIMNGQDQRIAELEEQLKNAKKETAKKVVDRVEELSVFDFKTYEEHDLRKYTITELALDVILREYGE